jgi:adenylate kinase
MVIIIFGPPGVGKGTQSKLIAKKLFLIHLSTGDILRKAVEDKTELGLKAKEIMNNGQLVSDDIMIALIHDTLSKLNKNKGFILDGFPRTIQQAIELDKLFQEFGFTDVRVISLTADKEELLRRMKGRGRVDDSEETILKRFEVFEEQTNPVQEYFINKAKVYKIEGVGGIQAINDKIIMDLMS